jgi:hypothetical protein
MTKEEARKTKVVEEYARHNDTTWFEGHRASEIYSIIIEEEKQKQKQHDIRRS